MIKLKETEKTNTAFVNFRSLLDENKYEVTNHRDDINYVNRLTFTKTKFIE